MVDLNGPLDVRITSDGAAIPDSYEVVAVRTRAETNRIPEAVIVIRDGDVVTGEFAVTDAAQFNLGAAIQIRAAYGAGAPELIFGGIVTANRLRLRSNRRELEVTCRDKAFLLQFGQKSQSYVDQKESDILDAIIGAAGLTCDLATTDEASPQLIRTCATDWDFILARAEANGLVVTIFDGKVTIKKPETEDSPVLTLTYGVDIIDFDAEVNLDAQYSSFTTARWDPVTQKVVKAEVPADVRTMPGDTAPGQLAINADDASFAVETSGHVIEAALSTLAGAPMARAALASFHGQISFQGSALANLGQMIEIKGMATRFNGTTLITGVVHRIEDGNWITETSAGLSAD